MLTSNVNQKKKTSLLCWPDEKLTAHAQYRDIMAFCHRTEISSHLNDAIISSLLIIISPRVAVECTITRTRVPPASSIPVVMPSKASNCGRSLAGIAGSNPAEGSDVCLVECCVLSGRGLCNGQTPHPEESYRVCVCVLLSVLRCNNSPLHLKWVGRKRPEQERK